MLYNRNMIEYYKKILLNAGIEANDNDIQNLKRVIDQANAFGCSIDIYDIVNILSPRQINATKATEILSKIIEENKNEHRKIDKNKRQN